MNPAPKLPPTEQDLTCRAWDHLPDAINLYRAMCDRLKDTGFILSIHGSVVRELGHLCCNDLDLIATQWVYARPVNTHERLVQLLVKRIATVPGLHIQQVNSVDEKRMHVKAYYAPEFQAGDRPRIVDLLIVTL